MKKLLMIVNEDRFFLSHRKEIALALVVAGRSLCRRANMDGGPLWLAFCRVGRWSHFERGRAWLFLRKWSDVINEKELETCGKARLSFFL